MPSNRLLRDWKGRVLLSIAPQITSVAAIAVPVSGQTYYNWAFTFNGNNFGSQPAFNGDNPNLSVNDDTSAWQAGFPGDLVGVNLTKWSNSQITITGYTGDYGGQYTAHPGDAVHITVDNPSSGLVSNAYALKLQLDSVTVTPLANQTATTGVNKSFALGSFTESNATGPYSVDVNWGDGTTDTKFTASAAGTLPAKTHTYAKAATDTVSVVVTDAKAHKSNTAKFIVSVTAPVASISGTVFNDANANGKFDSTELGLGLWQVYLDVNKDGKYDAGDKLATTDADGNWSFKGLAAGSYVVRVVQRTGTATTTPGGGAITTPLTIGQNLVGKLFGEKRIA